MTRYLRVLFTVGFLTLFAACGGGGGGGDNSSTSSQAYLVSPTSLTFHGELDGATPEPQNITITANKPDTIAPDIIASGDAIVTTSGFNYCPNGGSNLVCQFGGDSMVVIVPVPAPDAIGIGTFTGTVLIQSSELTVSVPVTYTVTAGPLSVDEVSPNPIIAGQTGEMTIRGHGFMDFGAVTPTVTIGTATATNVQIVNNTTIKAVYPSLPAGTHNVQVTGGSHLYPSTAKVVVVDPQSFTAESLTNGVAVSDLHYDAERQALFLLKTGGVIQRLAYGSGSWATTPASTTITGVRTIHPSLDGTTLVAGGENMLYELNPVDLTVTSSLEAFPPVLSTGIDCVYDHCFDTLARTSHGAMIALDSYGYNNYYFYDLATKELTVNTEYIRNNFDSMHVYGGRLYGSKNGLRTLIRTGSSGSYGYKVYDDIARTLLLVNYLPTGGPIGLDAAGKVIVVGTAIFKDNDDGFGYVAHSTLPELPLSVAVSPDGLTVYALLSTGTTVRPYDISQPAVVTPGTDIALPANPGTSPNMTISPDGNTLFIAGQSKIVIQPVN